MSFARFLEIERRPDDILRLIRTGRFSTPMLAEEVGVSILTISRCVNALRLRWHDIRTEKHAHGWRCVVARKIVRPQKTKSGSFAKATTKIHERDHDGQ